jgi:hypothetical protein
VETIAINDEDDKASDSEARNGEAGDSDAGDSDAGDSDAGELVKVLKPRGKLGSKASTKHKQTGTNITSSRKLRKQA